MPAADDHEPPRRTRSAERGSYRSGFAFGVLSFLAVAILGVVSTIVTARLYGVEIIGQFALVSVPIGVLLVLSNVKEQQALIREITGLPPRSPRVRQLFAAVFTFSAGLTLGTAVLVAAVCVFVFRGPLHAPELIAPTLASIAGYVIVTNTGWNIDSILSAFVAGRQIFWIRLHEVLSFIVIAMVAGLVWRSVWGLVIATVGASLTSLAHRMVSVRPFVQGKLSRREYRAGLHVLPDLLRFGVRAAPGQVAQGISQLGGVWALGMVTSVTVVGAYSRAQTIPQRLQQSSMRMTEVLYPTLVGRHTKGDGHGFDRALIDSIRYEIVGMLLIAAAIGGAAHSVLEVFGPGFSQATPALALLMLYPALASVTVTQTQALWATDRPGRASLIAFARLGLTILLLAVLTPSIGIVGPAIALLAGYVLVIVLNGLALRLFLARPLHATWPRRERLALGAAYAAGFVAANLVEHALPTLAGLPVCLAAATIAYIAVLLLCRGINGRDRHRFHEGMEMARAWRERRRASRAQPAHGVVAAEGGELADPVAR